MIQRARTRRPGFTILELLVVIGILTLLIGILVPTLSAARRQAKANTCLSRLKGLGTAFTVYLTENRDEFPPARLSHVPPSNPERFVNHHNVERPRWQWFLELDSGPVIDPRPFQRLNRPWDGSGKDMPDVLARRAKIENDVFVCPTLDDPEYERSTRNGAFGYNYQYLGNGRQDTIENRWDNFSVGLHQITAPSGTVMLADSRGGGNPRGHGIHSYTLDPPRRATEKNSQRFGPTVDTLAEAGLNTDPALAFSPAATRHNDRANVIFADSHGEAQSLTGLGYEIRPEDGLAIPVHEPTEGTMWTNKAWTGTNGDPMIDQRPQATP